MSTDRDYLAAGLALGGLSDAELAEAQALADSDADFRAEVASYDETMSLVAESDEPVEVSADTRAAILGIPSTHAQEGSADEPQEGLRERPANAQEISQERPVDVPPNPATHAQQTPTAADPVDPTTHAQQGSTAANSGEPTPPASLADHRERSSGRGPNRRARAGRSSWLPYAAAAAALIVVAGFGVTIWQQTQHQNQLEEDLASTQQQLEESTRLMEADDLHTSTAELPEGGTVTVLSSESEQLIRFSPRDVGQAPAGKSMQMWVIGDDGPASAGLMTGEPVTIAGHEFSAGSVFGITVEPEGGSEQPTTDPVVAINL
ncbi:MAG: anti-sigma factor domain-containing protein [Brevibacterium sp.]